MKKNIIILFLSIMLTSCIETVEMQKSINYYGFDFTKYTQLGFLFTPEGWNGEYESVGILKTILYPAVRKYPPPNYKPAIGDQITMSWLINKIEPEEAIEGMYNKAVDMGADAIIKFEIKSSPFVNGVLTIQGIEVTGFAIKRK